MEQIDKSLVDARRGRFLPEGFRFSDKSTATFSTAFDL